MQRTGEDDTTALQAAIDKASEGSIVYPVGECVLTNTGKGEGEDIIAIKSGVTLDGRYCPKVTFKYTTVLERWRKYDDDVGLTYSIPTPQNIFRIATNSIMKNVNFTEDTSNMTDADSCVFPVIVRATDSEVTHCTFDGIVSTGVCSESGISMAYASFIGNANTVFEYNTIKNLKTFEVSVDCTPVSEVFNIAISNCRLENVAYGGNEPENNNAITNCYIDKCAFLLYGKFANNEVYNSKMAIATNSVNRAFANNYLNKCSSLSVADELYIIGNYFINPTSLDINSIEGTVINNVTNASSFGDLDATSIVEGNITGI